MAAASLDRLYSGLLVTALELALIALVCGAVHAVLAFGLSRAVARGGQLAKWAAPARIRARHWLVATAVLLITVTLSYNIWLFVQGIDVGTHTASFLHSPAGRDLAATVAVALVKIALSAAGLVLGVRLLRRLLRSGEEAINRWDRIKSNNKSLAALSSGLERVIVNVAWLLLAALAAGWLGLPTGARETVLTVVRIYLVLAVGVLIVRCTTFIVDTLDGWSERSARKRGWAHYYEHVRPLVPTFRACLEYALWVIVASLVLLQVNAFGHLAAWGPRVVQAIGIFFVGRVVIEIGSLEIGNRMLPAEGLEPMDRRRRETTLPLVLTTFTYAVYFATAVLILGSLGFNPLPFLAGAGILGVVIGFGAQSLIDDVVSGFFILFENTYLVGDTIEVGEAKGVVEAIEFRTTKIRDRDGRVHIIRNGQVKPVINYSKDYTMAVVTMEVAYDADLYEVFQTLERAGQRLRLEHPDVLGDTEIEGITQFGAKAMTVRTATRVKPGRHDSVATALRLLIKEMFDRQTQGTRRTLIPHPRAVRGM
jgi:small conductance mechanosensitive channel